MLTTSKWLSLSPSLSVQGRLRTRQESPSRSTAPSGELSSLVELAARAVQGDWRAREGPRHERGAPIACTSSVRGVGFPHGRLQRRGELSSHDGSGDGFAAPSHRRGRGEAAARAVEGDWRAARERSPPRMHLHRAGSWLPSRAPAASGGALLPRRLGRLARSEREESPSLAPPPCGELASLTGACSVGGSSPPTTAESLPGDGHSIDRSIAHGRF